MALFLAGQLPAPIYQYNPPYLKAGRHQKGGDAFGKPFFGCTCAVRSFSRKIRRALS